MKVVRSTDHAHQRINLHIYRRLLLRLAGSLAAGLLRKSRRRCCHLGYRCWLMDVTF